MVRAYKYNRLTMSAGFLLSIRYQLNLLHPRERHSFNKHIYIYLRHCSLYRVRDLGVFVDCNLTFHSHIDKIVARAFIRSNLILKCFVSRDASTLMRAFTVYVRPIFEYSSCVWSPYQMRQIKQIESVQRSFTRRLLYHTCIDYKTRLIRLGVDSLAIRRLRQDLIYTYKIVFGLVTNAGSKFFTLANSVNANINTRGHMYKVFPHHI